MKLKCPVARKYRAIIEEYMDPTRLMQQGVYKKGICNFSHLHYDTSLQFEATVSGQQPNWLDLLMGSNVSKCTEPSPSKKSKTLHSCNSLEKPVSGLLTFRGPKEAEAAMDYFGDLKKPLCSSRRSTPKMRHAQQEVATEDRIDSEGSPQDAALGFQMPAAFDDTFSRFSDLPTLDFASDPDFFWLNLGHESNFFGEIGLNSFGFDNQ